MGRQLIAMGMGMGIMPGSSAGLTCGRWAWGEDVDDPSGGAGPLPPGAPCPDRVVTRDGTPAHG